MHGETIFWLVVLVCTPFIGWYAVGARFARALGMFTPIFMLLCVASDTVLPDEYFRPASRLSIVAYLAICALILYLQKLDDRKR